MAIKIKFGTDGWRAAVAEEYTFENVRRCTQGFASYLIEEGNAGEWVVVGHDKRYRGEDFAVAVAEVLAGMRSFTKGSYEFYGGKIEAADVVNMSKLGLGYIPEDRKKFGIVETMSIAHNFLMRDYTNKDFYNKLSWLKSKKIVEYTKNKMKEFDIRSASEKTLIGTLSGGNIQKVILARELSRYLRFLLACQPIRGLDINASRFIQKSILKAKSEGLAVLLISEDLDELLYMSDRLYVICGGKIVGSVLKDDMDIETIGLMMTGVKAVSCAS